MMFPILYSSSATVSTPKQGHPAEPVQHTDTTLLKPPYTLMALGGQSPRARKLHFKPKI